MVRKNAFFEGWSCFKFNNLGLALEKNLKFNTSVAKGSKLKVRKFLGLIPTFVAVTGENLVGGGGFLPFWIGLTNNSALPLIQLLLLNLSKKSDQVLSVCGTLDFTFCFGLAGLIFTGSMSSDLLPSPFSLLSISISYRIVCFFWYAIHFLSGFLSFPFAFRSKILKNFNFFCAF